MRFFLRLLTVLFFLAIVAGVAALYAGYKLLKPAEGGATKPVIFEIHSGASGAEIASQLHQAGLVEDVNVFRMLLRFHSKGTQLRPGHYKLDPGQAPLKLFEQMLHAEPLTRKVTFPEGLTIPEMAPLLQQAQIVPTQKTFVDEASRNGKAYGDIFPANLEGYLFPETYTFPWETNEKAVVERLTRQFKDVVLPKGEKKKKTSYLKSLHEMVILASLVEREARVDSDRGLIAGVYINRLKLGMTLDCDATIQFALGKPKAVLLLTDLELDSPYNSYKHPGLPPGPIANAGLKSFEAAISPTPSKYLYYCLNEKKGDGSHVFSRSYAEHQAAINQYMK